MTRIKIKTSDKTVRIMRTVIKNKAYILLTIFIFLSSYCVYNYRTIHVEKSNPSYNIEEIIEDLEPKKGDVDGGVTEFEKVTYLYSDSDLGYMYRCVETEVYGASFEAKCNVASVIINRVNNSRFADTITGVVTSPNQFAYFRTSISDTTKEAVKYVLENGDTTSGALFFHSNSKSNTFNGASYIFTDDAGHHFYK